MIVLFLIGVMGALDLQALYDKATTGLVNFQSVKDSAVAEFVKHGSDPYTTDTIVAFLVSKFDTKSSIERHTIKNMLKDIGEIAIPGIVARIDYRGSDAEARALKQSLWVLGEIGGIDIIEPAARFVGDVDWAIRSAAYTTLGKSGSYTAMPYIQRGLDDKVALVRKSAYHAMSVIATEREVCHLVRGLSDPFYGVRYAALSGLRRVGATVFQPEILRRDVMVDYFVFCTRTRAGMTSELDALIMSLPMAVRKAAYATLSKKEMMNMLQKESHPLLVKYLKRRIERVDEME